MQYAAAQLKVHETRQLIEERATLRSGKLRKFSLGVRAPPRRGEWIFEGDLGVSDLRATARRSRVSLSVLPRKENDKNIYVPGKLEQLRGPKRAPSKRLTHLNCTIRRKLIALLHAPLNSRFNYFIARYAQSPALKGNVPSAKYPTPSARCQ